MWFARRLTKLALARRLLTTPVLNPRPRLAFEQLEDRTAPAVFTVTTAADSGAGSLRQAILDANAATGVDTIQFNIPATDPNHIVSV